MKRFFKSTFFVKVAVMAVLGVAAIIAAIGVSYVYAQVTESDETAAIFTAAAELPPEMIDAVEWQTDAPDLRRQMEPATREMIAATWVRAWEQLSIISQTGDTAGAEVYFSGSALTGVSDSPFIDTPLHQINHQLQVTFYSLDGQVLGLRASNLQILRGFPFDGSTGWKISEESYDAVLILQDGNWRVNQWVRTETSQRPWTEAPSNIQAETLPTVGINYYPKDTPFASFWPQYDPSVVAEDLQRVAGLGADSVRIFLPFDYFGGGQVSEESLAPVINFLDLAHEQGIHVVVTLFDGHTDHRPIRWNADGKYIRQVADVLKDHPALILWDLKNEADLDFGRYEVEEQLHYAWLNFITHELRTVDTQTPTTVGWSSPEAAIAAPVTVDVVSFHHYRPVNDLQKVMPQLRSHADGRPLLLTEFGLPTYNTILPGGHTEAEQASYIAKIVEAAEKTGINGTMLWTLWDLNEAPIGTGFSPWKQGQQKTLGVLRADGSEKPAAALLSPSADISQVYHPGIVHRLTQKTFWRFLWGVLAFFIGMKIYRSRRKKTAMKETSSDLL